MITLKLSRAFAETRVDSSATATPPAPHTGLCTGCVYAHLVQGFASGEEITYCGYLFPQREVLFAVRECTDYRPERERDGEVLAIEGAVSFPPLEEVAAATFAMAATRDGEGE